MNFSDLAKAARELGYRVSSVKEELVYGKPYYQVCIYDKSKLVDFTGPHPYEEVVVGRAFYILRSLKKKEGE